MVLDNIVHCADPSMRKAMLSRLNLNRSDYLRQAEKIAQLAQSKEIEARVKHFGRDVVSVVDPLAKPKKVESVKKRYDVQGPRKYYHCDTV